MDVGIRVMKILTNQLYQSFLCHSIWIEGLSLLFYGWS